MNVRGTAARAVGRIGPKAEAAISTLVKMIKYGNTYRTASGDEAAIALGRSARSDSGSHGIAEGQGCSVSVECCFGTERGRPAAVPELVKSLKDKDISSDEAFAVEMALGRIGPPAVPSLMECLDDRESYIRCRAAATLREIGPPKSAIPL